jgi:hypothetical protein
LDSDEDMNLSLAILDAIEEDFHRVVKVARPKTKGRREMLNLVSSINYGDAKKKKKKKKKNTAMQARPLGKGKARLTYCSVECSLTVWV